MDMRKIKKHIKDLRSEGEMIDALNLICTIAQIQQEYSVYIAYSNALYWIVTGRLSGICCYAIRKDIYNVCKHLNTTKKNSTDEIGEFLESYYQKVKEIKL